jgi:hypothetical protein
MPRNRDEVHDQLLLAGDALVVTSGLFAWLASVAGALMLAGWDMPAVEAGGVGWQSVLAGAISLLMLVSATLLAPATVWWLHGRRASLWALLGALLAGPVAMLAAALLAPALSTVLGFLLKPLTDWEFAGPIALLVIVGIGYLVALVAALFAHRPAGERRGLHVLRWISAGGLVVLAAVVVAAMLAGVSGEFGEAPIFAMVFGAGSAVIVTGADIGEKLGHRPAAPANQAHA